MQVYLVGGAVRDELLGRPVLERDWVVVGASPGEMERLGYRAVGRDFPVFLHPQTHEEYALARRERKIGPGYRGFTTQFSPDVTLEQDLQRRDLTINAIARDEQGHLIDPFGGQRDLQARLLRHVSEAFVEDPVRILRLARFAARFASLGFKVAPETLLLMRRMVDNGEVRSLVPERLWRELSRALTEPTPEACFDLLQECGALPVLLPELRWDACTRQALQAAVQLSPDAAVRFAALLGSASPEQINVLCERLRVPTDYRELAVLNAGWAPGLPAAADASAAALLALLERADAYRRAGRFEQLLLAAEATLRGHGAQDGTADRAQRAAQRLREARSASASVTLPPEQLQRLAGPQIAAAIRAAREAAIEARLSHSVRRRS
jgi:tRNA nucleotidyltransferase (CCA-adding enzyme)